jgi:predicted nucleotidyltransferase
MDLSHPLRSLVPSLDSAALEVLAGTESALGTSQIQRLAGRGSWAGYQRVLDRLVAHGLVLSEPTNNGFVYRLNRDHLLAPTVLAAAAVRPKLLTRIANAVAELTPPAEHASIFGSFARGEGDADSDIDLFLVMPLDYDRDPDHWTVQLQQLEDQVQAWTGNRLEVLVLDRRQLADATAAAEPVLASIRADAITLHGPDVAALLPAAHRG